MAYAFYLGRCALALDAAGQPHIFYSSGVLHGGNVSYAYYDGNQWLLETVDGDISDVYDVGGLALDALGQPHVVYARWSELRYARRVDAAWQTEVLDYKGEVGLYNSLALDSQDRPHISYQEQVYSYGNAIGSLRYAHYDGTAWRVEVVDDRENTAQGTSLKVDALDRPHIGYLTPASLSEQEALVQYAWYDGTAWQRETVEDSLGYVDAPPSLALDSQMRPHRSYLDGEPPALKYAYKDGASWQVQTVDASLEAGENSRVSLALDAQDRPHISYYREATGQLRYAYWDGAAWQIQVVDSGLEYPAFGGLSLALDSAGNPHISYFSYQGMGHLYYASFDGSALRQAQGSALRQAQGSALRQAQGSALRQAQGSAWRIETVALSAGWQNTLALDNLDRPYISFGYLGQDPLAVGYAFFDGMTWQTEVVDNNSGYNSLALDSFGWPHISHSGPGGLKYASRICQPVEQLNIAGPAHLSTGHVGLYTGMFAPPTATLNLSWNNGAVGQTAAYSWTTPGLNTVTVTGASPCSQVTATMTVDVYCQAPEAAFAAGPARLPLGIAGLYSASYTPLTTSLPLTVDWSSGALSPTAAYSWTITGTQTVALTASNSCGLAGDALTVTVFCQPLQELSIAGPGTWVVGPPVAYLAGVQPLTVSRPLTLTWDNGSRGAQAIYNWPQTGTYTLTVTGTNPCGRVFTATFPVRILAKWPYQIYLPLLASSPFLSRADGLSLPPATEYPGPQGTPGQ